MFDERNIIRPKTMNPQQVVLRPRRLLSQTISFVDRELLGFAHPTFQSNEFSPASKIETVLGHRINVHLSTNADRAHKLRHELNDLERDRPKEKDD